MSELAFRNIDASPADPVESWPYEGLVTAMERGYLSDWKRIAAAIRAAPWGLTARSVLGYAGYGQEAGVAALLAETVRRARAHQESAERQEVAAAVRFAITESELTGKLFAAEIGTSASRLSTYATGRVQPSAAMLIRIQSTARHLNAATPQR